MKRSLWLLLAFLVIAVGVVGCGDDGGSDEAVTITFASYGGAYQEAQTKAWLEPFMEANPNITIVQDEPTDYAKVKAMVEAGNVTWDVVDIGNDFAIGPSEEFCEKIDDSIVPMSELQPDKLPTTGYRVPDIVYSVVVGYRTDQFGADKPASFADFFDLEKFPGKRGAYNFASGGFLEMALLADGVPVDELYPLDLDRAFAKIDTIKDSIVWWDTGAQSAQLLADGEVSMGMSWNGRVSDIMAEGAPVEIMWDQHILTADYLMIPKGTKNLDAAMKLVAWITSAENSAEISNHINYAPPNEKSAANVPADIAARLPSAYLEGAVGFDDMWWGANYDEINTTWLEYVAQ